MSGQIGKDPRYSGGVRGEWTKYELNTSAGNGQQLGKRYTGIFPNISLSAKLKPELDARFSYVSKITRPRYQALNPWVIYQDPFTSIQGNPGLIPERIHAFEAALNYKHFDLRAGYNFTGDPISAGALRGDGPSNYALKAINLEKDHTFFISGSMSLTIAFWNTTSILTVTRSNSIDNQYGFELVKPRPQLYAYTNNTFDVGGLFKIQLVA